MEDWERHFQEKSRRRAEKERRRDLTNAQQRLLFALAFLAAVAAAMLLQR